MCAIHTEHATAPPPIDLPVQQIIKVLLRLELLAPEGLREALLAVLRLITDGAHFYLHLGLGATVLRDGCLRSGGGGRDISKDCTERQPSPKGVPLFVQQHRTQPVSTCLAFHCIMLIYGSAAIQAAHFLPPRGTQWTGALASPSAVVILGHGNIPDLS